MSSRSQVLAAAAISALALCAPALQAQTAPASNGATTAEEIKALRQRLDQLEAQQKATELQRQDAERRLEAGITSEKLGAEAARHDQFMTDGQFTAGYSEGKFIIQSDDGKFLLHPWIHFQFRDVTNWRENFAGSAKSPDDQTNNGFEVRRVRLGFDGNLFSTDFTYFFDWNTQRTSANSTVSGATAATAGTPVTVSNNAGGTMVLQQAWAKYHIPSTPFFLKAGQIKDPLLHEQIVDPRYQQGTERSLTADIFANGDDFTEGATVIYDPGQDIRAEAGITHGMRSANTNFLDFPNNGSFNAFDYGFAGRAEYKVMGHWADYNQVGAVGTKDPLLVVGTGIDYSERGHSSQTIAVVDAMYADGTGLSLYGSFLDRYTTHSFGYYVQSASGATILAGDAAVAGRPTNEYSILLQAGYLIDKHWEPFGRYEYIHLQGTPAGAHNYVQALTGGVNYYFHGHSIKVTGEVLYLPNGLPFDDTPNDVLANFNGKAEVSFIAQLQVAL